MNSLEIEKALSNSIPIWNHLKNEEKELLVQNSVLIHYHNQENVHGREVGCVGVLLIRKGSLRVYLLSEEGKEVTLFHLGANDICMLSASCVLANINFDVFIDAEEDTDALVISANAFSKVAESNIYLECFAYQSTTERFGDVMWAMQQILFMRIDTRLAIYLLDEVNKNKTDCLEVTHETIAKYIGSAREVVSRMLKYFEKEGIVELYRGGILVIDKVKLRDLTQ